MFSIRYLTHLPVFSAPGLTVRGLGINETMPPCYVRRPRGTGDCLFMLFHDPVWLGPDPDLAGAPMPAGTMMLWTEGAAHFYGNPGCRWRHSWVHCAGRVVDGFLAARDVRAGRPTQPGNAARIARSLIDLHEELGGPASDAKVVGNLLENLVRETARKVSPRDRRVTETVADGLARARVAMEARYDERLTLRDLAKLAGLSAPYFCSAFREHYGLPPVAFLIQRRMAAALALVRGTDLSVAEVGRRVGYPDSYHFSKLFKQHFGRSPKTERER